MKKAILLLTDWEKGYWGSPKEAPYPKRKYTDLPEWDQLSKSCPLPALGIYSHFKQQDLSKDPFIYLQVTGMRYDRTSQQPFFTVKPIAPSKTYSYRLINTLPPHNRKLFSAIDAQELLEVLNRIGEGPPSDWMKLIDSKAIELTWRDYVGKYFLQMELESLGNDEFEDRIFSLLTALGFEVNQKGHRLAGEYADGVASFEDYGIVYDCKNTSGFVPSAADIRAIDKYVTDEKRVRRERKQYPAFIAKSFGPVSQGDFFLFAVTPLLYLLYKKIMLGPKFVLNPIKKILENKTALTDEVIENEWRI